jgi:hypothetical protein
MSSTLSSDTQNEVWNRMRLSPGWKTTALTVVKRLAYAVKFEIFSEASTFRRKSLSMCRRENW